MKQICEITGIDLKKQKITNYDNRKIIIHILKELGVLCDQILLQSKYYTVDSLKSYKLS